MIGQMLNRARPRLVIGAVFGVAAVLLLAPPARAQGVPAGDDSAETVASANSLVGAPRPVSVVLVARSRIPLPEREPIELRQSTEAGTIEHVAFTSDTTPSKGRRILLGMGIGVAAGGGLGYLAGKAWCDSHDDHAEGPPCEIGLAPLVALSAFVGLIAGGIIGAHAERALPGSPVHRVAIDAVPNGARGMAVAVTLR
jgi:hypothetical protein